MSGYPSAKTTEGVDGDAETLSLEGLEQILRARSIATAATIVLSSACAVFAAALWAALFLYGAVPETPQNFVTAVLSIGAPPVFLFYLIERGITLEGCA